MKRLFLIIMFLFFTNGTFAENEVEEYFSLLRSSLPSELNDNEISMSIENGVWAEDNNIIVSSVPYQNEVIVYAIVTIKGKLKFIDISFMGNVRGEFSWAGVGENDPIEAVPIFVEYQESEDCYLVNVRKRAWINGQRYTMLRPLVITMNGELIRQ